MSNFLYKVKNLENWNEKKNNNEVGNVQNQWGIRNAWLIPGIVVGVISHRFIFGLDKNGECL